MKVGFNYAWAWDTYGLQLGPYVTSGDAAWDADKDFLSGQRPPQFKPPPTIANLARNLAELSAMGISVVRWFLLGNAVTYGKAPTRTFVMDGSEKKTVWKFKPPLSTDPRFTFHFREMLKLFRSAKMQLIPSITDYAMCGDSALKPDSNGLGHSGRADLVRDKNIRSYFLNNLFLDLVLVAREFRDVIYAVEVMNEPIWTLLPPVGDPKKQPIWKDARENANQGVPFLYWPLFSSGDLDSYLSEALDLIKSVQLPSTVGHRFFDDLQNFKTGSLPQFHYYAKHESYGGDPLSIPTFSGNPPPFLGEFASDKASADQSRPWPDLSGNDTTLDRLKLLESRGCQLCLIWPDLGGKGVNDCSPLYTGGPTNCDAIKLHPDTVAQIRKYTGH